MGRFDVGHPDVGQSHVDVTTMKFNWTPWKKKKEEEPVDMGPVVETSRTMSAPLDSAEEANSCHKILALINSPAQILGQPIKGMSGPQLKAMFRLTMAQVHCGPGYKEEHVDIVLSGAYPPKENN